jgi:hypothetical protein
MRRLLIRTIPVLTLVLLLVTLGGCGGSSTTDDTATGGAIDQGTSVTYPPGPADVSGLAAWFEQAYPGADWLSRITDIQYVGGEVPDSGGFANAVVLTTDLDYQTEQAVGQEIVTALGEADLTWAKQYVLWFADGNNEMAGDLMDMTP